MSATNALTQQILNFLFKEGAFAWRQNTTGIWDPRRGIRRASMKKGVSDILGCYKGRMLAIELKIGSDTLSPEQEGFLASVAHAGGIAFTTGSCEDFLRQWKLCTEKH